MDDFKFENTRYNRQEAVPLFGSKGQKKLASKSVAVVGAGGVKSSLLLTLASSGVGKIRIIDFDRVELSNLNRQILFDTRDIGQKKCLAAHRRLTALNPDIEIEAVDERVNGENFEDLLSGFDLVFEGGDSAKSRLEFNKKALQANISYIHASAQYNYAYILSVIPQQTACFACAFHDLPGTHGGAVPVMGTATLSSGALAASEAISFLVGKGFNSAGMITLLDCWKGEIVHLPVDKIPSCIACCSAK